MPKIRSLAKITEKYGRVTPAKGKELEAGLRDPKKIWVDEAAAAGDAWKGGVEGAIARDGFVKGVVEAGQAAYIDPALKLGVGRYRSGVEFGTPKYGKKFGPYRDVIEGTSLPPRGPVGDPANIERVRVMAAALHEAKVR
ncbi:hypothetical protein ES708_02373 [subsurface metagenome]